jgi:hypothetical protein
MTKRWFFAVLTELLNTGIHKLVDNFKSVLFFFYLERTTKQSHSIQVSSYLATEVYTQLFKNRSLIYGQPLLFRRVSASRD